MQRILKTLNIFLFVTNKPESSFELLQYGKIGTSIDMRIKHRRTNILVKYGFELRRTCPNYWWKKVLTAYCHFKSKKKQKRAGMPPPPLCTDYSLTDLLAPAQWKNISSRVNETEKVNVCFTVALGKPRKNFKGKAILFVRMVVSYFTPLDKN